MCTPFMYNKYECIFGLTGSVGGAAERAYIEKTYKAVAFEVSTASSRAAGSSVRAHAHTKRR